MGVTVTGITEDAAAAEHGTDGTVGMAAAMAADVVGAESGQTGTAMAVQDAQTGIHADLRQQYLQQQQQKTTVIPAAVNKH